MKRIAALLIAVSLTRPALAQKAPAKTLTLRSAQDGASTAQYAQDVAPTAIFGFRNPAAQHQREKKFMAVPSPALAREHLRKLTAAPHIAGSPEDRETADYVAQKFREAGLKTEVVEYKVWLNYPVEISVDVVAPTGVTMHGPSRKRVNGDTSQSDPRIVVPFNANSPSGDVEAEVVYANYGRPEDLAKLKDLGIEVRGKILLLRYGQNYRGAKTFMAQEHGAAGVILYSDPMDDGWFKGDPYPTGPWRPDTAVQRGSVGYSFEFAGDPTTPGIASLPDLPEWQRTPPQQSRVLPNIPVTPLSSADAAPILRVLGGPVSPRDWQGALPVTYHIGPGPVRVRMHLKQDYGYRTIWNVIGTVAGTEAPDEWAILGNHRDAWVYGAVDPGSGQAALLETVHGIGALLKSGWRPKRTLVFASWDAEEYGLIGSTEWAEQHARELANAVAYFNTDIAVSGPNFGAACDGSLKQFIRDITKAVPSPAGRTVYGVWLETMRKQGAATRPAAEQGFPAGMPAAVAAKADVPVGDLGSGSDYSVFLDHLGVPSCDVGSSGPYGVYHSAFDNFAWFEKFADPQFVYVQQQARVLGLQMLRMGDADVLPYDFQEYANEIGAYVTAAKAKARIRWEEEALSFGPAEVALARLQAAAISMTRMQNDPKADAASINRALRQAQRALLLAGGLPGRPWFRHAIYAPGEYTGYAAVLLPGVTEAIDAGDQRRAREQLTELVVVLARAGEALASAENSKPAGGNVRPAGQNHSLLEEGAAQIEAGAATGDPRNQFQPPGCPRFCGR
ncbi:MAG: M28 family metallopeptidase [Terriglobales bacterium]